MDFLGIGPLEIVLILIVGLLIFGPEKLPQMGRDLGKTLRSFKKATTDISVQVSKELEKEKEEINSDTKQIKQEMDEISNSTKQQIKQEVDGISNPVKPEAAKTPTDGNPL